MTKQNKLREEIIKKLDLIGIPEDFIADQIIEAIKQQIESSIPEIEKEFEKDFPVMSLTDGVNIIEDLSDRNKHNKLKSFLITKLKNII